MPDLDDLLRRERERFRMGGGALQELRRRRDRRRRTRQVVSGALALVIAGLGTWGAVVAFGGRTGLQPGDTPTPPATSPTGVPSSPSPTGTVSPPAAALPSQPSGPIHFVDEVRGWVVSGGDIFATTDGGATWDRRYDGPLEVTAVQFVDADRGWAVSEVLLRTSDGGVTWSDTGLSGLASVQFATPERGWGVVSGDGTAPAGVLVGSEDGGATWRPVDISGLVDSICVHDARGSDGSAIRTLWAAGATEEGVTVFKSLDEGSTWDSFTIALPAGPWTTVLRCAGIDAWVLVAGGGAAGHQAFGLLRTGEGGPAAVPVLQEAGTHPFGDGVPFAEGSYPGPFAAFDGVRAYFVAWCPPCGNSANFMRTFAGGTGWQSQEVLPADQPFVPVGMSFIDPERGWLLLEAGSEFRVLETTDGGSTWSEP